MPKPHRFLGLALSAVIILGGCVTAPEESSRVRLGMSRDDLKFFFGEPLRVEPADQGGEVWVYRVVTPGGPRVDGTAWEGPYEGSGGVALGISPNPNAKLECPIFLSPEGRVVDPIPEVNIRGR